MAGKERYGMGFRLGMSDVEIEIEMIRLGGQWLGKRGQPIGNGLLWHYRRLEELLWPTEKVWHRWNELQLEQWLEHRTVGIMGPSSTGKTCNSDRPVGGLLFIPGMHHDSGLLDH